MCVQTALKSKFEIEPEAMLVETKEKGDVLPKCLEAVNEVMIIFSDTVAVHIDEM